jgi:hypothetical protein
MESNNYALHAVIVSKNVPLEKAKEEAHNIIKDKKKKYYRETKQSYRFRNISKQKFKPKTYRTKKINENTSLIFGELKPEYNHLKGSGFFDYLKEGYETVKEKVKQGYEKVKDVFSPNLTDYDNKTSKTLLKVGNIPITKLEIYKAPITKIFQQMLNTLSLGKWEEKMKKYGFDKFYHLGLIVTLENGEKYIVEKLDRPSVSQDFDLSKPDLELMDVPLKGKELTIYKMLEDARKAVGDKTFFEYDSFRNNCQFFVRMLLKNQNLYTDREKDFFFQDISEMVKELPEELDRFQRFATDTTATIAKLTGQGDPTDPSTWSIDEKIESLKQQMRGVSKATRSGLEMQIMRLEELKKNKGGAKFKILPIQEQYINDIDLSKKLYGSGILDMFSFGIQDKPPKHLFDTSGEKEGYFKSDPYQYWASAKPKRKSRVKKQSFNDFLKSL